MMWKLSSLDRTVPLSSLEPSLTRSHQMLEQDECRPQFEATDAQTIE